MRPRHGTSPRFPGAASPAGRQFGAAWLAIAAAGIVLGLATAMAVAEEESEPAEPPVIKPAPPAPKPIPTPAQPAFYTAALSRVRNIDGDTFEFEREDRRIIRVRLFDAECESLGETARSSAKAVAKGLLEPQPFWVFPCGTVKGGTEGELAARVWTAKGWLAEILIKAGYAKRRADPSATVQGPPDAAGTANKGPLPAAPAMACMIGKTLEGDMFEITRDGKPTSVRLFDVLCQELDSGQREAARAVALQALAGSTVWVFPSGQRNAGPGEEKPVRIWTKEGWLDQVLLKSSLAKRYADPDKPTVAVAVKPEPSTKPGPATKPGPVTKPGPAKKPEPAPTKTPGKSPAKEPDFKWVEVTLSADQSDSLGATSKTFKLTSPEWRISWDLRPARIGLPIQIHIYRVDETWVVKTSSVHVASFTGNTGAKMMRSRPGDYWIRLVGCGDMNVKVEQKEPL
jgi:endonuclease YncB( thermonuclease family)